MPRKEALIEPPEIIEAEAVEEEKLPPPQDFPRVPSPRRDTGDVAGEITEPPKYTSRVVIHDAWQYLGHAHDAPDWIDRNWIGYANDDELRQIPAGPCLKIPTFSGELMICRIGDYVAKEETLLATGVPGTINIKVWNQDSFQRFFLPATSNRPTTPSPSS